MNVTVVGGMYGVDYSETQPAATIVGFTLINQTCAAVMYCGLMTLTVVGLQATASLDASAAAQYVAIATGMCGETGEYGDGDCKHTFPSTWNGVASITSQLSVVDSSLELRLTGGGSSPRPAFLIGGNQVSLENTFVRGFHSIAYFNSTAPYTFILAVGHGCCPR